MQDGAGDAVGVTDVADVSNPSRSILFDDAVVAAFLASSLEFFGECSLGRGAGIATLIGDGADLVGSGIVAVVEPDFFFLFKFSSSSSISLSQSTFVIGGGGIHSRAMYFLSSYLARIKLSSPESYEKYCLSSLKGLK